MKHLGDITLIKGNEAPIVDCIIGGSPCQDLSVAGKRAGLAGERSGLYMEQIRIIKEMRHKDELRGRTGESIRPRYMVWENVPGAFSSNKGKDFAAVIEEAIKVVEQEAPDVPVPEKGWPTSGCIMGDNWSVAWRVLDAQFWGVPQRRRRIALVADFGGHSAPEILFIRKGVSRDLDESEQTRKTTAGDASDCTGADDREGNCVAFHLLQDPVPNTISPCMGQGNSDGGQASIGVCYGISSYESNAFKSSNPHSAIYVADTSRCLDLNGGNPACNQGGIAVVEPVGLDIYNLAVTGDIAASLTTATGQGASNTGPSVCQVIAVDQGGGKSGANHYEDISPTLTCTHGGEPAVAYWRHCDVTNTLNTFDLGEVRANELVVEPAYCIGNGQVDQLKLSEKVGALNCMHDQQAILHSVEEPIVIDRAFFNQGQNAQYEPQYYEDGTVPTLVAKGPSAVAHGVNNVRVRYIVRRLTPLECERLQGFPDGWTDIGEWVDSKGKKHKEADSPRYKALGNSIAIPPWKWVLKRLCACYERDATMASLFDGIGGFPYIWEQLNGKGSCLWASEIEEFPMAVTKLRFGGKDNARF